MKQNNPRIKKVGVGVFGRPKKSLREAFDEFLAYKKSEGLAKKTIESYVYQMKAIWHYIDPETSIYTISNADIRELIATLADRGGSPNTVRSYTAALQTFFTWARSEGYSDVHVKLYKGVETAPETYTEEELMKLLEKPKMRKCTFVEYRSWVIVNLLVNNGLRAGSIRAILNCDVDLDNSCIMLRHTKNRRVQLIPLSTTMSQILTGYMEIRKGAPSDCLFCECDGSPMSETALSDSLERYNRSRGVERTGIHKFRHTFARMYITAGGNALKLQKLLGHSTLRMTEHYVNLYDRDILDGYDEESPLEALQRKRRKPRIKVK